MDARIDIFAAFGIALGDAHIIRNAGGNAEVRVEDDKGSGVVVARC